MFSPINHSNHSEHISLPYVSSQIIMHDWANTLTKPNIYYREKSNFNLSCRTDKSAKVVQSIYHAWHGSDKQPQFFFLKRKKKSMGAAHSLFYWWILGSQSSVLIIRAENDDVVAVGVARADLLFAEAAVAVGAPGVPAPDRGLAESPYEGPNRWLEGSWMEVFKNS